MTQRTMKANSALPNTGGWQDRHNAAVVTAVSPFQNRAFETPLVAMLLGWEQYAVDHKTRYDSPIGDDGVLGPHWRDIGLGLRGLLNGDCGPRLDCGTLDAFLLGTLEANGVETESF